MHTRSADPFLDQEGSATSRILREQEQSRRQKDDQATIQSLRDQLHNQSRQLTANRTWPGTSRTSSPEDEPVHSRPGREAPTLYVYSDGGTGPLTGERRQPASTLTETLASAWPGRAAQQNQHNIEESLLTSRAMSDQRLRESSVTGNTQREQAQRQDLLRTFDHSARLAGERTTGLVGERAAGVTSGLSAPQFTTPNADARAGTAPRPWTQASLSTAIFQNNQPSTGLAGCSPDPWKRTNLGPGGWDHHTEFDPRLSPASDWRSGPAGAANSSSRRASRIICSSCSSHEAGQCKCV